MTFVIDSKFLKNQRQKMWKWECSRNVPETDWNWNFQFLIGCVLRICWEIVFSEYSGNRLRERAKSERESQWKCSTVESIHWMKEAADTSNKPTGSSVRSHSHSDSAPSNDPESESADHHCHSAHGRADADADALRICEIYPVSVENALCLMPTTLTDSSSCSLINEQLITDWS